MNGDDRVDIAVGNNFVEPINRDDRQEYGYMVNIWVVQMVTEGWY